MVDIPTFGELVEGVEYTARPGGYAVIRDAEGRIAVVRTPKGYFLPGGAVENSESAEDAAIRETEEETGLRIHVIRHIGRADQLVYKKSSAKYFRKQCEFYLAQVISDDGQKIEEDHILEWLSPYDAQRALSHESQLWAVDVRLPESQAKT
jgi:8-oxo-dGTP pyrophosphatase MutT (NUDIX family)